MMSLVGCRGSRDRVVSWESSKFSGALLVLRYDGVMSSIDGGVGNTPLSRFDPA